MRIYSVGHDEKCGGCNWEVHTVYFAAESQQEAEEMYKENYRGLCADCLVELFEESGCEIFMPGGSAVSG